jgi:hypothetical protein
MPRTTARRENAPGVQFVGNRADADDIFRPHVIHDGAEVSRTVLSVGLKGCYSLFIADLLAPERPCAVRVA